MGNSVRTIADFYRSWLEVRDLYDIVKKNSASDADEFIQHDRFLWGWDASPASAPTGSASPLCRPGDKRVDVPVWFGDPLSAQTRVLVLGLEPRDTDPSFNIEKVGNKVFATPFGVDRWNERSSITRKPQNKYFRVFNDMVSAEGIFVVFSDVVKDYDIVADGADKGANDIQARSLFAAKASAQLDRLMEEIELIAPNIIITLGKDTFGFLKSHYPEITHRVRHPAQGGERQAIKELRSIGNGMW